MITAIRALVLILVCSASAQAGEIELKHRFGLGVGVGAAIPLAHTVFTDATNTGFSAEGHVDYFLSNAIGLEGAYNRYNYKSGSPVSNSYSLGLLYRFIPTAVFTPVLGVGAGWATTSGSAIPVLNYDNWTLNAKFGLDYAVCNDFIVGIKATYAWLFTKSNGRFDEHGLMPQISGTWFFGGESAAPAATPAPVMEAVQPVDGDDDNDGVLNSVDKCPGTPAGTKVNSFGCPVDQKVEFTIDVQFDTGKSVVKPAYQGELEKMATLLKEHTDATAEIQGYSDNTGKKASNVKLSAARAKAVETYLVKKLGVAQNRLSSKGYGPENPVDTNDTAEGRAKNRRVVASFSSK